jgi:MerR-like DNA binding protein
MSNGTTLSIGEVAERAGRAPSAIRYYERAGLLPPARRESGRGVRTRISPHQELRPRPPGVSSRCGPAGARLRPLE